MAPTDPPALETKLDSAETVVAPLAWDAAGFTLPPEEVWAAGDARYEAREPAVVTFAITTAQPSGLTKRRTKRSLVPRRSPA